MPNLLPVSILTAAATSLIIRSTFSSSASLHSPVVCCVFSCHIKSSLCLVLSGISLLLAFCFVWKWNCWGFFSGAVDTVITVQQTYFPFGCICPLDKLKSNTWTHFGIVWVSSSSSGKRSDTPAAKCCTSRCLLSQTMLMRAAKVNQNSEAAGLEMKDDETLMGDANSGEQSQMFVSLSVSQISLKLNLETFKDTKQRVSWQK